MIDAQIQNFAPQDKVEVEVGRHSPTHGFIPEWRIKVERDASGQVFISVRDIPEAHETRLVLGKRDETQLDV